MMINLNVIKSTVFIIFCLFVTSAMGSKYNADEYVQLLEEANSRNFVRVLITLDNTVTLEDMASKKSELSLAMEEKGQKVLAELGKNSLTSGYWNNGIGQMGVYVEPTQKQ